MRGLSRWATCVGLFLAVFLVFGVGVARADDDPPAPPTDPPEARVQPPGGVTTQARANPPVGVSTQARVQPPGGVTARLNPPSGRSGQMSWLDMLLVWLQSRLSIPHG